MHWKHAAMAALVLAAAAACGDDNPLIGTWVLVPEQGNLCGITQHVFTASADTSTVAANGSAPAFTTTASATYNINNDNHVILEIGPVNHVSWQMVDSNHIRDTSGTNCLYQRQ